MANSLLVFDLDGWSLRALISTNMATPETTVFDTFLNQLSIRERLM